jgi:hypothetical protein
VSVANWEWEEQIVDGGKLRGAKLARYESTTGRVHEL